MGGQMKISVIMSTHDGRKELCKRAIESVIAQTFTDWELVICDDASKDGTNQMVKDFNNPKIKYIHRDTNFGNDTRPKNEAIMKSTGSFVAFLDSDNVYRPDHLQSLFNEIEKTRVDVVYGDRWIFDQEKSVSIGIFHDFDPFLMLRRNYIDTSDVLVKREAIFEVGGFDERYKKYVDWNLWVRMCKAGYKFKRVPLVITDYHVYPHSKSNRKEDEKGFSVPAWDPMDCEINVPHLSPVKEPTVAVFSITYDRLELTKKCFDSLHATADYKFKHFIVDNHSTDGTQDYLKEYAVKHQANITFNEDNKGISIASNQALKEINGKFDIVVKVDNDAFFLTKGWLKRMVDLWKANRMLVMSPYIQGLKDNPGGAPREDYGMVKGEYLGLTRHIGGIVHFVDANAYKDFRWDERSTLHGVQDLELSNYLRTRGYLHCYLENFYAEHLLGTEGQHKAYPEYFERRKSEKQKAYGDK
jgi:glycosyltransferase involved in cell wall biosynthesis